MLIKFLLLLNIFLITSSGPFVDGALRLDLGDKCNKTTADKCYGDTQGGKCIGGLCCEIAGPQNPRVACFHNYDCCYNEQFPKLYKCIRKENSVFVKGHCTPCRDGRTGRCQTHKCLCCGTNVTVAFDEFCPRVEKGGPCEVRYEIENNCKSGKCNKNGFCE